MPVDLSRGGHGHGRPKHKVEWHQGKFISTSLTSYIKYMSLGLQLSANAKSDLSPPGKAHDDGSEGSDDGLEC
jgi:hypothetical protein